MYTAIQEMRDERGERLILHSPNIVNLCIDSYDEEKQCGRLYHQYTDHTVMFSSLFEALDRMERLYDEIQFPQAATRFRSFREDERTEDWCNGSGRILEGLAVQEEFSVSGKRKSSESMRMPERNPVGSVEAFDKVIGHRGEDATFIIRVQYRQYSSWQGEVTWMDGRCRLAFRSVLELARLIDNAMNVSGKEATEPEKRTPAMQAGIRRENGARSEAVSTTNDDGK